MALLISGSVITPIDKRTYQALPRAYIYVNDHGVIESIQQIVAGSQITEEAFLSTVGHHGEIERLHLEKGEFLIPGFIDTHTHAPQFPSLGAGQEDELLEWLENTVFPTEAKFGDVDFATKAYTRIVKRIIDSGTTTCCYYGSLHLGASKELARIVHGFGQRAFLGKCNMDRNSPSWYREATKDSLPDTKELIAYIKELSPSGDGSPYVHPILTPRFAIATSDELIGELGEYAKHHPCLAIQTHISENPEEVKEVKRLFAYLSTPEKPITYAGVYDHFHLLRNNTILGHAVHLEEEELKLIKKREAAISHCPTSNFNLTSGMAKVGDMLDRGIKVGLGTDVSGGFAPSILRTIQDASIAAKVVALTSTADPDKAELFASKPLKIATLFWLATLGGAEVCNLEDKIGSLKVGKSFDAIVVDIRNTPPRPHDHGHGYVSPRNPNLWGVGDDEELGLDIRRRRDEADEEVSHEKKLEEELDAMLERFMFCGDDRNLRRVYVQGQWIGGTEHQARG